MKHYAGLDVSVKETSVCIVDEAGKVCREVKVPSHPEDLVRLLKDPAWQLERIGLEAGPLSQWLSSGLAEAGLPVVCIETRHTKAFLKAQVNKSDQNDARGIARSNWQVGTRHPSKSYPSSAPPAERRPSRDDGRSEFATGSCVDCIMQSEREED